MPAIEATHDLWNVEFFDVYSGRSCHGRMHRHRYLTRNESLDSEPDIFKSC